MTKLKIKKRLFECHVTTERPISSETFELLAKNMKWKTSCIERDPVLGKKTYFYFTTHDNTYSRIYKKMKLLSKFLGDLCIREKIEEIIYDKRYA